MKQIHKPRLLLFYFILTRNSLQRISELNFSQMNKWDLIQLLQVFIDVKKRKNSKLTVHWNLIHLCLLLARNRSSCKIHTAFKHSRTASNKFHNVIAISGPNK